MYSKASIYNFLSALTPALPKFAQRWMKRRRRVPKFVEAEEVDVPTFEIVYPYPCLNLKTWESSFQTGPGKHQVWYPSRSRWWNVKNVFKLWKEQQLGTAGG